MSKEIFMENPVIVAISRLEDFSEALASPCKVIFMLTGSIFNLRGYIKKAQEHDKVVLIHFDLIEGLTKDATGIRLAKEYLKPYGIISTRSSLIKKAKELELFAIQRLFLLDSLSYNKGLQDIKSTKPDAVEIMPGIIPSKTGEIAKVIPIPVIAGGLITEKQQVIDNLKAGALCISTGKKDIWYM